MEREEKIQKLCQGVLRAETHFYDNPNGAYESTCPFCGLTEYRGGKDDHDHADINEIKHDLTCVYLIAKDLSSKRF